MDTTMSPFQRHEKCKVWFYVSVEEQVSNRNFVLIIMAFNKSLSVV